MNALKLKSTELYTAHVTKATLHQQIDGLSRLNKSIAELERVKATMVADVKAAMRKLGRKTVYTAIGTTATLFAQLQSHVDREELAKFLTPKQLKRVIKVKRVSALRVSP